MGLVSDPTRLRIDDIKIIPNRVPRMILYEATLVTNRIIRPMPIAIIEVSPTDPGI